MMAATFLCRVPILLLLLNDQPFFRQFHLIGLCGYFLYIYHSLFILFETALLRYNSYTVQVTTESEFNNF